MSLSQNQPAHTIEENLWIEMYDEIWQPLQRLRTDQPAFEARKGILAFVRGLRFQAVLIYRLRKLLEGTPLTASWGAILSDDSRQWSPECDIILHNDCWVRQWNGEDQAPIMDFRFVRREHAKLVISCKSVVGTVGKRLQSERRRMDGFVDRVWLFAECCNPAGTQRLQDQSTQAGYEKFWYLYGMKRKRGAPVTEDNPVGWVNFIREIRALSP